MRRAANNDFVECGGYILFIDGSGIGDVVVECRQVKLVRFGQVHSQNGIQYRVFRFGEAVVFAHTAADIDEKKYGERILQITAVKLN